MSTAEEILMGVAFGQVQDRSVLNAHRVYTLKLRCRVTLEETTVRYVLIEGCTFLCESCGEVTSFSVPGGGSASARARSVIRSRHKGKKATPRKRSELARSPLSRSNPAQKIKRFQRDFGGEDYVSWIKSLSCDACGKPPISQCSHVHSRNGGGVSTPRWQCIVPHCWDCHREFERGRKQFEARHGDLDLAARRYVEMWETFKNDHR